VAQVAEAAEVEAQVAVVVEAVAVA